MLDKFNLPTAIVVVAGIAAVWLMAYFGIDKDKVLGAASAVVLIVGMLESAWKGGPPAPPTDPPAAPAIPPHAPSAILGALLVCLCFLGCPSPHPTVSPADVEAGVAEVNSGCTYLQGVTSNGTILTICAIAEEVAYIVSLLTPTLFETARDAGAPCQVIAGSAICATPEQLGKAIQSLLARRQSRLFLDAGSAR